MARLEDNNNYRGSHRLAQSVADNFSKFLDQSSPVQATGSALIEGIKRTASLDISALDSDGVRFKGHAKPADSHRHVVGDVIRHHYLTMFAVQQDVPSEASDAPTHSGPGI